MPKKRMPAAERQQESAAAWLVLHQPPLITGRIPGLVPGHESALTWAGGLLKTSRLCLPVPRGKLGAGDGERT
jgi:hypothetical protein